MRDLSRLKWYAMPIKAWAATVMTHEFEDANLAFIRDLFVFMNFTALSFVDLKVIGLPLRLSKN